MADRRRRLLEIPGAGRLGRHVNHDPRSLAYRVRTPAEVTPRSVGWERHGPILDQGDLGSCVPNSATAMLMCDPFWWTLDAALQRSLADARLAEQYAVQAYRDVTRADPFDGAWEPDDTGSDGLSIAKVWRARGLNNGYQHVTDIDGAHTAIQQRPFIIGTIWLAGMDRPRPDGTVAVTGSERGGHEYLCREYDAAQDLWWFDNSWTTAWGRGGRFAYDTAGLTRLLRMEGDVTVITPSTAPAPTPTPPAVDPATAPYFTTGHGAVTFHGYHPLRRRVRGFATYADAIAAHLRPCRVCRPKP